MDMQVPKKWKLVLALGAAGNPVALRTKALGAGGVTIITLGYVGFALSTYFVIPAVRLSQPFRLTQHSLYVGGGEVLSWFKLYSPSHADPPLRFPAVRNGSQGGATPR